MSTASSAGTSASYNSVYRTNSRVTGLFSDMDTDTVVKNMCSVQQARIDKVKQQQTKQEWLGDALTGVKNEINDFMKTYLSQTGTNSMLKSTTYMAFKATTSSTSNSVTVTPTSNAEQGNISVQVNKLAKNASAESASRVSKDGVEIAANNTAKLSELSLSKSLTFGADGKLTFGINGRVFSFDKDTSLQTMINTINSDKTANVTMKYSRLSDTFSITADSGGADSSVAITNYTGNAFGPDSAFGISVGNYRNGSDSEAVINGSTVTRDSNTFTIDGVSYELQKVTKGTSEEVVDFSLKRDYSETIATINKFIDAYNTLYSKLKDLVSEKDYSSEYPPLTDDQKAEMSSEQISAWEKKAKSGLLRNNKDMQSILKNLQNAFYSTVGGTGMNVTSIGITTAGYYETNAGEKIVNEEKLTAALQNDADMFIKMFTNGNSTTTGDDQGLMYKLRSLMYSYTSTVSDTITSGTSKITSYTSQINDLEDKLSALANRYYTKFSNMETAMSKLNTQSSMLSQMFSGS